MKTARVYRQEARARATQETGERILDAAVALFWERPTGQIALDEVAGRAGVSVQTVLRRFGSKDGLFAAAAARESERVQQHRATAPVGDLGPAVTVLVEHYEQVGTGVLRLLAEEQRSPELSAVAEQGRQVHLDWCRQVFAPALTTRRGSARSRLLAQLVAVCDVHTWHLLRQQGGLSRAETERALVELLAPLVQEET
ncbi:MAG TPA: TetR/AcrR family transcriptional regulator [Nocardioides sp.]|uniref:TetR/AcrR family transcriptional regulator n=1 Tax=Nocardioides sp. TaxID=35761 RepID=UPI002BA51B8F|nr:TetR/AcrR family transcriptional regulator [Nocardioides sp.]HQR25913.1 TetR/AcrR family transcriptional regulator [Nocardioides sp.]